MAYDRKKRDEVRSSYVYQGLSLKDCGLVHEVTYGTVREWRRNAAQSGDDWDTARNAARMAQGGLGEVTNQLLEQFALQSQTLMAHLQDPANEVTPERQVDIMAKLTDSYSKLVASAGKSGSKVAPLSVAMQVIKLLEEFIKQEYPEHRKTFLEVLSPFGVFISKELMK